MPPRQVGTLQCVAFVSGLYASHSRSISPFVHREDATLHPQSMCESVADHLQQRAQVILCQAETGPSVIQSSNRSKLTCSGKLGSRDRAVVRWASSSTP